MILKNKKMLIVTSLLTLLPIPVGLALWDRFPDTMAIHFGFTGQPDGFASPAAAVFLLPLFMLVVHWVCILFTALDKGNRNRNQKLQAVVLWCIPILTNLSMIGMYAIALDVKFSPVAWTMIPMGLMFAIIGNYMPKTRMNSTMGIKVPWAFSSEENWNATHRFAGKIWFAGGIAVALCALLPHKWAVTGMLVSFLVLTIVPILYSWRYYRMQKARGDDVSPKVTANPKATKASLIAVAVILALCAVLLFTGDIEPVFGEDSFTMKASYYSDRTVKYEDIEAIEYREGNVPGLRVGGFGSFRLLMGFFENEEFGTYTRYTYYNPESCVVVTAGSNTIVLSGKNAEETRAIYDALLAKIEQ